MQQHPTKSQLRQLLLEKRRSLTESIWKEKSDRLCRQLQSLPLFQSAQTILAYFPFRKEPDISPLFTTKPRWGFSRCVGQSLIWHIWKHGDKLQQGFYGIQEPDSDLPILNPSEIDLILVPAVACDYQGYRLGYGGGFYDRMLNSPEWELTPTIGIIFDFAYLPQLPIDPWDKKLNIICTDYFCFFK